MVYVDMLMRVSAFCYKLALAIIYRIFLHTPNISIYEALKFHKI